MMEISPSAMASPNAGPPTITGPPSIASHLTNQVASGGERRERREWTSYSVPWSQDSLVEDIHNALLERERTLAPYKARSPQLHQRRYLVDWLAMVCEEFSVCDEAKHLAVHLLDYFMDNFEIDPERIHLFVLGCLLVACKFEELDSNIPRWHQVDRFIVNSEYGSAHYQQMELMLLGFFNWNICMPTACHFTTYYTMASLKHERATLTNPAWIDKIAVYLEKHVKYFLEISLQYHMYRMHAPSFVAVACVAAGRASMNLNPIWPDSLSRATSYTWEQISVPVRWMLLSYEIDDKRSRYEVTTPCRSMQDSGYMSTECNTPSPAQCKPILTSPESPPLDENNNNNSVGINGTPCASGACAPCPHCGTTDPCPLIHCSGGNESGIMSLAASPTQLDLVQNFNDDMVLWSNGSNGAAVSVEGMKEQLTASMSRCDDYRGTDYCCVPAVI